MGFTFSENDTAKEGRATLQNLGSCKPIDSSRNMRKFCLSPLQNLGSCKPIDSSRNMRMFCLSPPSRPSIYSYSVLLAVILH